MADQLYCNRTRTCMLCKGVRRSRQTSADAKNDTFYICPDCDTAAPSTLEPRDPRGRRK
jgi:hypothetical protein